MSVAMRVNPTMTITQGVSLRFMKATLTALSFAAQGFWVGHAKCHCAEIINAKVLISPVTATKCRREKVERGTIDLAQQVRGLGKFRSQLNSFL